MDLALSSLFAAADQKEFEAFLKMGAVEIPSPEESDRVRPRTLAPTGPEDAAPGDDVGVDSLGRVRLGLSLSLGRVGLSVGRVPIQSPTTGPAEAYSGQKWLKMGHIL